jgi:hypothetical protein
MMPMADFKGIRQATARIPASEQPNTPNSQSSGQGTGVHQPVVPNQRKGEASQQQGQQGGQQGQGKGGETVALAKALKNLSDTGISRAVSRMTGKPNIPQLPPGVDNVLRNVGIHGAHTFAMGSLIPSRYLRRYYKLAMGKRLRITGDMSEEEAEQIYAEMTNARLNRPMNRDLLANGHYDEI